MLVIVRPLIEVTNRAIRLNRPMAEVPIICRMAIVALSHLRVYGVVRLAFGVVAVVAIQAVPEGVSVIEVYVRPGSRCMAGPAVVRRGKVIGRLALGEHPIMASRASPHGIVVVEVDI